MEATIPEVPVPVPVPVKKIHGNKGRPVSEKQMIGLQKGMEAMRLKREENKKAKEEKLARLAAGGVDSSEEEPTPKKERIKLPPKVKEPKYREPRKDKGIPRKDQPTRAITREEFDAFRTTLLDSIAKPKIEIVEKEIIKEVEKPVDRIVEKVVEKIVEKPVDKIISGSALLNRIYFNR